MRWMQLGAVIGLAVALSPGTARAQSVSFTRDIVPILKDQCFACHNPQAPQGEFSLATFAELEKGGKGGRVLAPKAEDSRLVQYLEGTLQPKMPIGGSLTRAQIDLFKKWIDEGAKPGVDRNQVVLGGDSEPRVDVPQIPLRYPALPQAAALAWSADGNVLAVGTYKVVRLLDPASGNTLRELSGHADVVHDLKFSPDGTLLAAAGGPPAEHGEVKIWDVATGALRQTLTGHSDYIYTCSWSPDGKTLATGSYDKLIKVWDVETGEEKAELKDHADAVYAVAFNPDGTLLASASADRSVKMWDVASGRRVYTLSGHQDIVFSLAWNPAGSQIVTAGADRSVRLWNVNPQGGNPARNTGNAHEKTVNQVIISANGERLASVSDDRTLKIWNAGNGEVIQTIGDQPDGLLSVTFNPDATLVAVGSFDGTVRVYKVEDGSLVGTMIDLPEGARRGEK